MADSKEPGSRIQNLSSPGRRLTRSRASKLVAIGPSPESNRTTEAPKPTDSEKGVLGKGKISFSFKKRLQASLVQYSDEDSPSSEKEEGEDQKRPAKVKAPQSARKSTNLPPTVPKKTVETPVFAKGVEDIPVPQENIDRTQVGKSDRNKTPTASKSQEPPLTRQRMCTRYTTRLLSKSLSGGSSRDGNVIPTPAGDADPGDRNTDVSVHVAPSSQLSEVPLPPKAADKLPNGRHNSLKFYKGKGHGDVNPSEHGAVDESMENHNSLKLYDDADDIEIKPVFALIQSSKSPTDQLASISDSRESVERKEISQSSDFVTKTACVDSGIRSSKDTNKYRGLRDDGDDPKLEPAEDTIQPPKSDIAAHDSEESRQHSLAETETGNKTSEREAKVGQLGVERDEPSSPRVAASQDMTKSGSESSSSSSSSLSSSSSSSSDSGDSSSSSSSSSSECEAELATVKEPALAELSKPHEEEPSSCNVISIMDNSSTEVVEKAADSSTELTLDTNQPPPSVVMSYEAASPYSPSKPTDEDVDFKAQGSETGVNVSEVAPCMVVDGERTGEKLPGGGNSSSDSSTSDGSSSSSGSSSSGSSASGSDSSSDSDGETEKNKKEEAPDCVHKDYGVELLDKSLVDVPDASNKPPSEGRVSPESSQIARPDELMACTSEEASHSVDLPRESFGSYSADSIGHNCVTSPDIVSKVGMPLSEEVRPERMVEDPRSDQSQQSHHYIIPPNAPSWNLVEITSTNSTSLREKQTPPNAADQGRTLEHETSSLSHDRTMQKEEHPDGRDRGHNRDRGHDRSHDRHRDYARSRRHRDDQYDAKSPRDRDRDRHHDERSRRYRRSKSREWDGRSRERRSRSKEREGQSWSRDRLKRSRSRDREHRSRSKERDRNSNSRDRKRVSGSRDKMRRSRSRDRERRSRSREHEGWPRYRGRERRSRSKDRKRPRDLHDRDHRRRRKSASHEREDHRRPDDKRDRHSSGHHRDDSRSHREPDKAQRNAAPASSVPELESIPLPTRVQDRELYLPSEPVHIPTISQSYGPTTDKDYFEHSGTPIIPEAGPPVTGSCQPHNLIYPPTVEMDNVSDIESVDMDVTNSPDQAKTPEQITQTHDVQTIPVINQRLSSAEKAAARIAFSMKTVPKKSSLFRQVLGVFDDEGGTDAKSTRPLERYGEMPTAPSAGAISGQVRRSSGTVSLIPLPGLSLSAAGSHQQSTIETIKPEMSRQDLSKLGTASQEMAQEIPRPDIGFKETTDSNVVGATLDIQSCITGFELMSQKEKCALPDEGESQRTESEVEKDQSQVTTADANCENDTPITRRRSKRLKSLEEKKDVKKEEPRFGETKPNKQGKNSAMEGEGSAGEQHRENQADPSVSQSDDGMACLPKEQFASPESKEARPAELRTPSPKPEKVKSRWRRWSELEASSTDSTPPPPPPPPPRASSAGQPSQVTDMLLDGKGAGDEDDEDGIPPPPPPPAVSSSATDEAKTREASAVEEESQEVPSLPEFDNITEHIYVCDRKRSKCRKEARRMVCDCVLPTKEEYLAGQKPCGDDCLNRMLFIECGSRCPCSDFCSNKRFQKRKYAKVEPFYAGAKGWGLKTKHKIEPGSFIMEYVGEVLDYREFRHRSKQYSRSDLKHFYFMALNADEVIDATQKGNISRFINHSCDPNCETQKWTVNGQLRIGFFAIRPLEAGEELTFDYQFESYGQAQKCYCGSENCRGYIGTTKKSPLKDSSNSMAKKEKRKMFDDVLLEEDINDMMELEGMRKRAHVLELARLMVRAESQDHRLTLLKIIQDTKEPACLRLFLDYHGLSLLWSWMVDTTESSLELKVNILKVLKLLPITNKTVLKDSNIMAVVERWTTEISEARKEDAKDETSESSSSGRGTPIVGGRDASQSAPTTPSYEGIPHKKRKLFQQLQQQEEPSSSDGDTASESGKKEVPSTKEDTESQTGDPDSKESESEVDTTQIDVEKTSGDWNSPLDSDKALSSVTDIATELISKWGNLKEMYKIPKICAQERKKTEQELDQRYGLDRHDFMWGDRDRKRLMDRANWSVGRDGKRRRLSASKEGESKITKPKKILLPTPPEASLSKHERRALFEAQVKAQDQLVYQQQMQQLGQYPPGYQYDPNNPYPDPNVAQYPVDPNVAPFAGSQSVPGYPSDPSLANYPDPGMTFPTAQEPAYMDPNVSGQVLPVNPVVPPQMIVQPDGTYIPAPQSVSTSFQQPAIGTAVPDAGQQPPAQFVEPSQTPTEPNVQQQVIPGPSVAAVTQFVEQTPAPVVYQASSQSPYQAPVTSPFISQTVAATVAATPATVSYVATPIQQQAPQYVQTQPVQQVYYTTPQGQVIVQQQPVVFQGQAQVVAVAETTQGPRDPREPPPPPPSPPPRAKKRRLPPNWKTARDSEGKIYYYHTVTRQTQWDPPAWEEEQEDDMDLGTPTHDEPKSKKKTTTAAADTSTETAKRIKDHFRAKMSRLIVSYLNPYRRPDCKAGRITNTDGFKHLARKLTHTVLEKELKHCRHLEDLEVNENVKAKTKDYIKKYMSRFGPVYKKATNSP